MLLLICSQFGYYVLYSYNLFVIKEQAKQEIIKALPDECFAFFESTNNQIVWEEEEKEFSVEGKMYDVAKIVVINGTKKYCCLQDDNETGLQRMYDEVQGKLQSSSKHKKNLPTLLLPIFVCNNSPVKIDFRIPQSIKKYNPFFCIKPSKEIISIITPPPEV